VEQYEERVWEVEIHRPRGVLLLAAAGDTAGRGGNLVAEGPGPGTPPGGESAGAARCHKPGALAAAAGQARRSLPSWRRSMAGSRRALTLSTSRRPKPCSKNWGDNTGKHHTFLREGNIAAWRNAERGQYIRRHQL
jgi:hypothetical protein